MNKILAIIVASLTILSSVVGSYIWLDTKYAHQVELLRVEVDYQNDLEDVLKMLRLEAELNRLDAKKSDIEDEIERLEDVLGMYWNRRLTLALENKTLSISDQQRVDSLTADLAEAESDLRKNGEATEAIKLIPINNP